MAGDYGHSSLFQDWTNQCFVADIPSDLMGIQPFNPNLSTYKTNLIGEASRSSIEQHGHPNWTNDAGAEFDIPIDNLQINGEVLYPRSPSKSPGLHQYYDLQNADLIDQCSQQVDSTFNIYNTGDSNKGSSHFQMNGTTLPLLSGTDEFYTLEPRHNHATGSATIAHGYQDSQVCNPRDSSNHVTLGVSEPNSQSFGPIPSHDHHSVTLPETEFNHSGVSSSTPRYGFVGEPDNNGALGASEPSFSGSGAWQEDMNMVSETSGLSSGAVPRRGGLNRITGPPSQPGSPIFHPAFVDESSSSSSGSSSNQGSLSASSSGSEGKKRDRLPTKLYNTMSDEQKLERKRERERLSSKRHAEVKRERQTLLQASYDSQSTRNSDLRKTKAVLQRQLQLLKAVKMRQGWC